MRPFAILLVGVFGCGDPVAAPVVQPDTTPATITIVVPTTTTIQSGTALQLSAIPKNKAGEVILANATFTSSAPAVISVTTGGLAKAEASIGAAEITAHAASISSLPVVLIATPPPATCGQTTALVLGAQQHGDLRLSQCVINQSTTFGTQRFNGPQAGGTFFYDLYTLDIPAKTIVRITVTEETLHLERTLVGWTASSAAIFQSFLDPLVLNNTASATVAYQVLFTTNHPGTTGTYSIATAVLLSPP